jgi:serine/threonine protein kinase
VRCVCALSRTDTARAEIDARAASPPLTQPPNHHHRRALLPLSSSAQILENKGHGTAVDWWSFGTLLYEMMCGLPPFYDTNVQRMYTKILSSPLRFPSYLSDDARSVRARARERPKRRRWLLSSSRSEDTARRERAAS